MRKTLALTVIVAFSVLVLCTAGLFAAHADHAMGACPFAPQIVTLCTPETTGRLAVLLSMAMALLAVAAFASALAIEGSDTFRTSVTMLAAANSGPPPQPLILAFSDGLIQPKVFQD